MSSSGLSPSISVVVCTHKRPRLLAATLDSLATQSIEAREFEVIVVDNASRDRTPDVVGRARERLPAEVRYIQEARLGLGTARNSGVAASRGTLVAFIDDDAVADPGWLAALLQAFALGPDVWAVGGPVFPAWEAARPRWLTDDLLRSLSVVDWGDLERSLTWPERLIGTNAAFRRECLGALGGFRVDLGRTGQQLLGSEDTELQQRIHAHGKVVWYTPAAIVHHRVPAGRLNVPYFLKRTFGTGRSEVRLLLPQGDPRWRIFLSLLRRWPREALGILRVRDTSSLVGYAMRHARFLGSLYEVARFANRIPATVVRNKGHLR